MEFLSKKLTFNLIILILGMAISSFVINPLQKSFIPKIDLAVIASIDAGSNFEVYINQNFATPLRTRITTKNKTKYLFSNVPYPIWYLRLDPTDKQGSKITIYEIQLLSSGKVIQKLTGAELEKWGSSGLKTISSNLEKGEISYVTVSRDPLIVGGGVKIGEDIIEDSIGYFIAQYLPILLFASCLCVVLLGGKFRHLGSSIILMILAIRYLCEPLAKSLLKLDLFPPEKATYAVGYALYIGHSKANETIAFVITLLIAALVGVAIQFSLRHIKTTNNSDCPPLTMISRDFSFYFILIVMGVFFVGAFPQIFEANRILQLGQHAADNFDMNNISTWQYLFLNGYLPYRDYWFPYGGLYDQLDSFAPSLIRNFFHCFIVFTALLVSIYQILGRRRSATIAVLILLGILIETNVFIGTRRYFLALSAFLCFVALRLSKAEKNYLLYSVYGFYLGWIFTTETAQLIYTFPGVAIYLLGEWINNWPNINFRIEIKRAAILLGSLFIVIAAYVTLLYINGQLPGFIDFNNNIRYMAAGSSVPANFSQWLLFDAI